MRRAAHGSPWRSLSLLAVLAPTTALAGWSHDPRLPARLFPSEGSNQTVDAAVEDGSGGAFVFIVDDRNGTKDIYAQHLLASGDRDPAWPENGVALCTAAGDQTSIAAATDGAGGAFVCWLDDRSGTPQNYVTRMHATGAIAAGFPPNGLVLDELAPNYQHGAQVVFDGVGGAVFLWEYEEGFGNLDLHGARVALNGTISWVLPLASAPTSDALPDLGLAAPGVFEMTWMRGGSGVMYASRVATSGAAQLGFGLDSSADVDTRPQLAPDGWGGTMVAWIRDAAGTPYIRTARVSQLDTEYFPMVPGSPGEVYETLDLIYPGGFRNWLLWRSTLANSLLASIVTVDDGLLGTISITSSGLDVAHSVGMLPHTASNMLVVFGRVQTSGRLLLALNGSNFPTSGALGTPDGWLATRLTTDIELGAVCRDRDRGVLVFSHEVSPTNRRAYAMRVDRFGAYDGAPRILSVRDVAGDQGGRVRLDWEASYLDDPAYGGPIDPYRIWRQVPVAAAQARLEAGAALLSEGENGSPSPGAIRFDEQQGVTYAWEYVASQAPANFPAYSITLESVADSSASGPANSVYMVETVAGVGAYHWSSLPDSGHSVDNLPPATPAPFTAALFGDAATQLTWGPNQEPDLAGYHLHRGSTAAFAPSPANRLVSTTNTSFLDGAAGFFYKLAAVDVHGNRSGFALVTPGQTLDTPGVLVPREVSLAVTSANPSPGGVAFRIDLPTASRVQLAVHDVHGRLVRELVSAERDAGVHTLRWDGHEAGGARAASGIYFAALDAGGRRLVRRIVLAH